MNVTNSHANSVFIVFDHCRLCNTVTYMGIEDTSVITKDLRVILSAITDGGGNEMFFT